MVADAYLRDLVEVFGDKITSIEIERAGSDRPVLKIKVELLSSKDVVALELVGGADEDRFRGVPRYRA